MAGGWIGGEEHISYLFYKFCPLKLTNKLNKNYRYHEIKITRDLPLSEARNACGAGLEKVFQSQESRAMYDYHTTKNRDNL